VLPLEMQGGRLRRELLFILVRSFPDTYWSWAVRHPDFVIFSQRTVTVRVYARKVGDVVTVGLKPAHHRVFALVPKLGLHLETPGYEMGGCNLPYKRGRSR